VRVRWYKVRAGVRAGGANEFPEEKGFDSFGGTDYPLGMSDPKTEAEEYAAAYRQHATTLRNWIVAYGVGGPVIFLGNDKLRDSLRDSGYLQVVGWTFLIGVALQVVLSFLDKYADWICWQDCVTPNQRRWTRRAKWWVNANWPTMLLESASMILLAVATVFAFNAAF
jgi:hypothetical protein